MAKPTEQEIKDIRDASKQEKAYMGALTSTEPNEEKKENGVTKFAGKTGIEAAAMEKAYTDNYKKFGSAQGPEDDQRIQGAIQDAGLAAKNEMKRETRGKAKGGAIKKMASGGSVSASRRGDGIAQRGKTRGKIC